jgi:uncharacterized protein (DUF1800 family)
MTNWEPPRDRRLRGDDDRSRGRDTTPAPYSTAGYDDPSFDRSFDRNRAFGRDQTVNPDRSLPPGRTADRPDAARRPTHHPLAAPPGRPAPAAGGRAWGRRQRSRWVTGDGTDTSGQRVIDTDTAGNVAAPPRPDRRRALIGLGALAAGTAAALAPLGFGLGGRLFGDTAANPRRAGATRPDPEWDGIMSSPAEAAAAVSEYAPSPLDPDPVLHLVSRLTFGATPDLVAEVRSMGIDAWIAAQLEPEKLDDSELDAKLAELTTLTKSIAELRAERDANNERRIRPGREWVEATIARQIWSKRQLFEVMVDFWNDFLHVAAEFDNSELIRGSFDRDVIRRYALDNYPDMFVAANHHPALLRYLDQDKSRKNAINENLARENLELYTVGVDGGYTEEDVRQAAILQTGHSIRDDQYVYRPDQHITGRVKIMGFKHPNDTPEGGEAAAEQYYRYLTGLRATGRYIARSLAIRLVSDDPPPALVEAVADTYVRSGGAIKPTLLTLLSSTHFWASVGQKVRRPGEYVVATFRALGVSPHTPASFQNKDANATPFLQGLRQIHDFLVSVGHSPAGHPTPDGYPDVFAAWTSSGTLIRLWNEAYNILTGSRKMFTYVPPERLVGPKPPTTAGDYVEMLARNLVSRPLRPRERDVLLGLAGLESTTPVNATLNGAVHAVARALLSSPLHHLR